MSLLYSKPPDTGEVVFTSPTSFWTGTNPIFWTPPEGTKALTIFLIGGGGGGGGNYTGSSYAGGFGGSANWFIVYLDYNILYQMTGIDYSSQQISIIVGAGGPAGTSGTPGTNGQPGYMSSVNLPPYPSNSMYILAPIQSTYGTGGSAATSSSAGSSGVESSTSQIGLPYTKLPFSTLNNSPDIPFYFGQGGDPAGNGYPGAVIIRWYR